MLTKALSHLLPTAGSAVLSHQVISHLDVSVDSTQWVGAAQWAQGWFAFPMCVFQGVQG